MWPRNGRAYPTTYTIAAMNTETKDTCKAGKLHVSSIGTAPVNEGKTYNRSVFELFRLIPAER